MCTESSKRGAGWEIRTPSGTMHRRVHEMVYRGRFKCDCGDAPTRKEWHPEISPPFATASTVLCTSSATKPCRLGAASSQMPSSVRHRLTKATRIVARCCASSVREVHLRNRCAQLGGTREGGGGRVLVMRRWHGGGNL